MGEHTIKAPRGETWQAFAALCSRNNGGGMGNCWFTLFHREKHSAPGSSTSRTAEETADDKRRRVETGRANAALVFDGDTSMVSPTTGSPASSSTGVIAVGV